MRTQSTKGIAAAAIALLGMAVAPPLPAITAGPADGDNHPSVGFISGQLTDPSVCRVQIIGCHGVLIGPDVVLTTGFCADLFKNGPQFGLNFTAIHVDFDDSPFNCSTAIPVREIHIHPGFDVTATKPINDVGIMILETPPAIEPARLPALNENASLARGRERMQVVGTGGEGDLSIPTWLRRVGHSVLLTMDAMTITTRLTDPSVSTGLGGGQGTFVGETNEIAGISADGYRVTPSPRLTLTQRVDVQSVRDFLDDFVTLP